MGIKTQGSAIRIKIPFEIEWCNFQFSLKLKNCFVCDKPSQGNRPVDYFQIEYILCKLDIWAHQAASSKCSL